MYTSRNCASFEKKEAFEMSARSNIVSSLYTISLDASAVTEAQPFRQMRITKGSILE